MQEHPNVLYETHIFFTSENKPISDKQTINSVLSDGNDCFLKPVPTEPTNALQSNLKQKDDLSYYYAHAQTGSSFVSPPLASVPQKLAVPGAEFVAAEKNYIAIDKYSYDNGANGKCSVYIEISDIGSLAKDNIKFSITPRTLELTVDDLNGKNLRFAVPRLQCKVDPDRCRMIVKPNRVTLILKSSKDEDNWTSLYRKRGIGETVSDDEE